MRRRLLLGIVLLFILSFSLPVQADLVTSDIWVNAGSSSYSSEQVHRVSELVFTCTCVGVSF